MTNNQHYLTAKHIAAEKGYILCEPQKTDLGWEVNAQRDGKVPFTAISNDPDRAIQICLNQL